MNPKNLEFNHSSLNNEQQSVLWDNTKIIISSGLASKYSELLTISIEAKEEDLANWHEIWAEITVHDSEW